MELTDITDIVFVCVAMNHLGLISAVEDIIQQKLWIVDCPKCATFWGVLAYGCYGIATNGTELATGAVSVLAISFLCAWLAVWLELGMGAVDQLYLYCYEKIFERTADGTASADAYDGNSADTMPDVQISQGEEVV